MSVKSYDIRLFSFSHHNTSLHIRDAIAFSEDDVADFVPNVREIFDTEVAILSTCNRTEFYFYGNPGNVDWKRLQSHVAQTKQLPEGELSEPVDHTGRAAARHLFRVSSSMESLALGEDQILAQVKDVHRQILGFESKSPVLDRLYQYAIRAGKRVRTETHLCEGAVSISSASVELAKRIFGGFDQLEVALVGAGETCESAAEHFKANGANRFVVVNRGEARGKRLASEFYGKFLPLEELARAAETADVMVFATGAKQPLLTQKMLKPIMKKRGFKPLFLIDISNPRNVEPRIAKMSGVYLYNIDDLDVVIQDNLASRQSEIPVAESIVEEMVDEWESWLQSMRVKPTIANLAKFFEGLRSAEVAKYENKLDDQALEAMEDLSKKLTKKLLHNPILFLRESVANGELKPEDVDLVWRLFQLDADADD